MTPWEQDRDDEEREQMAAAGGVAFVMATVTVAALAGVVAVVALVVLLHWAGVPVIYSTGLGMATAIGAAAYVWLKRRRA